MLPPESCMSPAMQLSAVDLPHPEGPSRQMNSPRLTVSVSSSSALNALPRARAAGFQSRAARATRSRRTASFGLLRADLLIPDPERLDLRRGRQRLRVRKLGEPLLVLRPAVLLNRILAFFWRHRQRYILH